MKDVKELVRQHWDRRSANFDEEPSHGILNDAQARAWRGLIAKIAGHAPLSVIDAGCGTGFLSLLFAEAGHRVTGVDFAPAMLEAARAKALARGLDMQFLESDAESISLPPASADLIVERHVLWTLPDPQIALRNWHKLLRSDGRLVLIEGHWGKAERRDEYAEIHDRLPLFGGRPENEMADLVLGCGYRSVTAEPLMDADLWTETPRHPRYLVMAAA